MKSLEEVSKIVGLSRRTIQEYERTGVVPKPMHRTKRGYLRYDNQDISFLFQARFYRELGYEAKDIREIFEAPNFNRKNAITCQIAEMRRKKERLEDLITIAEMLRDSDISTDDIKFPLAQMELLPFDMMLSSFSTGLRLAQADNEDDTELDENIIEECFDQIAKILELIQCGYSADSDAVQSKIAMIHHTLAQSISPSIYVFWGICQMFSPGTELGDLLDEIYGINSANVLSQAAVLYSKKKMKIPKNHRLVKIFNQIERLHQDHIPADSPVVQKHIEILLEGLYEESGLRAEQLKKLNSIWKREAFRSWDVPENEKEQLVFIAQAIEAYHYEMGESK